MWCGILSEGREGGKEEGGREKQRKEGEIQCTLMYSGTLLEKKEYKEEEDKIG